MTDASAADDLVVAAQQQLDEHKAWLCLEISRIPSDVGVDGSKPVLCAQALSIGLRVARTNGRVVSLMFEYPDELYAFLISGLAPQHLRASLAGGHVVDLNKPASTLRRAPDGE